MRWLKFRGMVPAVVLLALAGCGDSGAPGGASVPSGTGAAAKSGGAAGGSGQDIVIDGSSTVYRISLAAQEAFNKVDPNVNVVVSNHGTGGGFGRYLQGDSEGGVDIVDASRPAKPDEESKAKAQALDWTRFIVGYDGITVVVNPKNTFLKSVTVEQLKKIWEPDSKVKTWKDVDSSWPDRNIVLYSPDKDSGTFEFFTEAINGKAKKQREDVQASSDDNTLVSGVSGDADGMGYFGYAYYAENKAKLTALPVQKGADDKPVMPSPATILDKTYTPLSRPLYIYVKNNSLKRPEVAAFVKYYLQNVAKLAEDGGYVAPTAEDRAENEKALSATPAK